MIEQPAARLLAAYPCIQQIDAARGQGDKTYEELTSKRPISVTEKALNQVTISSSEDRVCKVCQRAELPHDHDYRTCSVRNQQDKVVGIEEDNKELLRRTNQTEL
jgi:tRNA G18 (ribose-2'-O)-methylase SpoU